MENKICPVCGKTFEVAPKSAKKYCSDACIAIHKREYLKAWRKEKGYKHQPIEHFGGKGLCLQKGCSNYDARYNNSCRLLNKVDDFGRGCLWRCKGR